MFVTPAIPGTARQGRPSAEGVQERDGGCRSPPCSSQGQALGPRLRGDDGYGQGVVLSEPETFSVELNGFSTRVWRKGEGPKLGFLAGFGGLPRWIPFLDQLARERTVIVPSLPGFPGGEHPVEMAVEHRVAALAAGKAGQ